MKRLMKLFGMTFVILTVASNAVALPDMKVSIKVSGGNAYDYFIVGMMTGAMDGFDNAYDMFSPAGNMNDTYISTCIPHPEWGTVKPEFRSDIRSVKDFEEWSVTMYTNLQAGTPVTVALQQDASSIPADYKLMVQDVDSGSLTDIKTSPYEFTTSTSPITKTFKVIADARVEQPPTLVAPGPVDTQPVTEPTITGTEPQPAPVKTTFTVSGTVKNGSGSVIHNIKVMLSGSGVEMTKKTDSSGRFSFVDLLPGNYQITVERGAEFKQISMPVTVKDADVAVDIILKKGKK